MHDIYKNINEYSPDNDNKNLIVFDDMIADMINSTKLISIVTDLFIRGRKLNISPTHSHFKVPKDVRLNTTHFFMAKILNKWELQQIAINHSFHIKTEDFINTYRNALVNHILFLVIDTTLASDNPLRFRKILFKYNKNHDN